MPAGNSAGIHGAMASWSGQGLGKKRQRDRRLFWRRYRRITGAGVPAYHDIFAITVGSFASNNYWSSSENSSNNAWKQNFNNGNQNDNNKNNDKHVRAVRVFALSQREEDELLFSFRFLMEFYMDYVQGELFPPPSISLEEVFEAYYSCRKTKGNL